MLPAGGDVELDLAAAAVGGPLDAPHIGDQGPQFHAGDVAQFLEQLIGVCHLGDFLGVHEGTDLDDGEAGIDEAVQQDQFLLGGEQGFLVLQAVPQADLAEGDGRGQFHHGMLPPGLD